MCGVTASRSLPLSDAGFSSSIYRNPLGATCLMKFVISLSLEFSPLMWLDDENLPHRTGIIWILRRKLRRPYFVSWAPRRSPLSFWVTPSWWFNGKDHHCSKGRLFVVDKIGWRCLRQIVLFRIGSTFDTFSINHLFHGCTSANLSLYFYFSLAA